MFTVFKRNVAAVLCLGCYDWVYDLLMCVQTEHDANFISFVFENLSDDAMPLQTAQP